MALKYNGVVTPFVVIDPSTGLKPSLEATYGPFDSIDAAYTAITEVFEASTIPVGLTVGIKVGQTITNYWFNGGTAKANLVKKYPEGSSGGGYTLYTSPSVTEDSTTYLNTNFPNAVKGDHVVDTGLGNVYIKYSDTGWTKILGTILTASPSENASIMAANIISYK